MGFAVQMTVGAVLLAAGLWPVVATVVAIEAAIVTNHAWHRRWAWRDRAGARPWSETLLRAHLGAGGTSLLVGVGVVMALSGHVPPLVAQVLAVVACAGVNYWVADRWVFATAALVVVLVVPTPARADGPSPAALRSWNRYVAALEQARAEEWTRGVPAWATDADPTGARTRAVLMRGTPDIQARTIKGVDVDDATLEHWQGSLLLRGLTLPQAAERLRHPERYPQPRDVLALKVGSRDDAGHEVYLRLTRSMLISATYDTWHRVRHTPRGPSRLDSTAVATRIEELRDAGEPSERRLGVNESRGFLWQMQSYWRFTEVPGGVIVTCETITLSRPVPMGLGLVSRPIISRVARESMTTALSAWQAGWPVRAVASAPR